MAPEYAQAILVLWTAPSTAAIVTAVLLAQLALWRAAGRLRGPGRAAAWALGAIPLLSAFLWAFLGASFALCIAEAAKEDYSLAQILRVTGVGLLVGASASVALGALTWRVAPARILKGLAARAPQAQEGALLEEGWSLAGFAHPPCPVRIVDTESVVCLSMGGPRPTIVLSRGLLGAIDAGEVAAVLSHEWGHIRHGDAFVKSISGTLARLFFFDPVLKLGDPAIHRDREFAADRASARAGLGPELVSALVKIADRAAAGPRGGVGIVGPEGGWFARYPPLKERARRLLEAQE